MLWRGLASAFATPAAQALERMSAPRQRALLGLVPAVAVVLGPLIGYQLAAGLGFGGVIGFDALLLVLGAALVAPLRGRPAGPVAVQRRLATGWREIARRGRLLRALASLAAVNLIAAGPC
jgi:hypothetical protein